MRVPSVSLPADTLAGIRDPALRAAAARFEAATGERLRDHPGPPWDDGLLAII